MVRTPYGVSPESGKEKNDDQADRNEDLRLRLQDPRRHRHLPLQPLHLQELRLLTARRESPAQSAARALPPKPRPDRDRLVEQVGQPVLVLALLVVRLAILGLAVLGWVGLLSR